MSCENCNFDKICGFFFLIAILPCRTLGRRWVESWKLRYSLDLGGRIFQCPVGWSCRALRYQLFIAIWSQYRKDIKISHFDISHYQNRNTVSISRINIALAVSRYRKISDIAPAIYFWYRNIAQPSFPAKADRSDRGARHRVSRLA